MTRQLTDRQREVAAIIRSYTGSNGFPPTLREIADRLGVTIPAAAAHLAAIERKGLLVRAPRIARGIVLKGELRTDRQLTTTN
jgi:repressor LexA